MILWTLFGLVVVAGFFPNSPIGRLFRATVFGDPDRPDANLQLLKITQVLLICLILAAMGPAVLPMDVALVFSTDLALYLEVMAALMVAGAIERVKGYLRAIAVFAVRAAGHAVLLVRKVSRRTPRQRGTSRSPKLPRSDDDEPGYGYAFA